MSLFIEGGMPVAVPTIAIRPRTLKSVGDGYCEMRVRAQAQIFSLVMSVEAEAVSEGGWDEHPKSKEYAQSKLDELGQVMQRPCSPFHKPSRSLAISDIRG